MNMDMLFLPDCGKNKMPVNYGRFIVGVSSNTYETADSVFKQEGIK